MCTYGEEDLRGSKAIPVPIQTPEIGESRTSVYLFWCRHPRTSTPAGGLGGKHGYNRNHLQQIQPVHFNTLRLTLV